MGNNTPFYVDNYFGSNSMSINDPANAGLSWGEQNNGNKVTATNYDTMMCPDMSCTAMMSCEMMYYDSMNCASMNCGSMDSD